LSNLDSFQKLSAGRFAKMDQKLRFLIVSLPIDQHATIAAFQLSKVGHDVQFWSPADLPKRTTASIRLGEEVQVSLAGKRQEHAEVVLFRKWSGPVLPDDLHPADRDIANREFEHFGIGILDSLLPSAKWINHPRASREANKVKQLMVAQSVGFNVPRTCISNDPQDIRAFVEKADYKVVFKAFTPAIWEDLSERQFVTMTSRPDKELMLDDASLSYSPAIWQEEIKKAFELRITMFGEVAVTVKIDSQATDGGKVDWRAAGHDIPVNDHRLDVATYNCCRRLMQSLGLAFGSIDAIVDQSGKIWFLEVNPSAQFLWIEDINPEMDLLGPYLHMLAGHELGTATPRLSEVLADKEYLSFESALRETHEEAISSFKSYE